MTIPTEVAAVLAEMRELKVPNWPAGRILGDLADRLESALTKAEAVLGCGACGNGCNDLSMCRLAEESPPAVPVESGRKPLSETMYRGPAHPEGHREQFLDRRCLAADNVPIESLGRDAEPDEVAEYVEDYEYRGETEGGRDACYTPNERERLLIEDAIRGWEDRTTAVEPVASVPDGWLPIESAPKDGETRILICYVGKKYSSRIEIGVRPVGCPDDAACDMLGTACYPTHWKPLPTPPTNQEGAAP